MPAIVLQVFHAIRSEHQLMGQLEFDLLFRWLVYIGMDGVAWGHSVFSRNRDRLMKDDLVAKFAAAALDQPEVTKLP